MKIPALLALLFFLVILFCPVHAQIITFANPTDLQERDLIWYFPNGTLYEITNLTSSVTLPDDTDLYVVAKAHITNPLTDPGDWMDTTLDYFTTNVTGLIIGFALIAMLGSAVFGRR